MKVEAKDQRKRDKRINFWLTESEYDDIKKRAEEFNLSISEYLRMLALNADINLDLNKVNVSSSVAFGREEFSSIATKASAQGQTPEEFLRSLIFPKEEKNDPLTDYMLQIIDYAK